MAAPRRFVDEDISAAFGVPNLRARCFTPAALAAVRATVTDGTLGLEQKKARLKSLDPSEVVFERALPQAQQQQQQQQQGQGQGQGAGAPAAAPAPPAGLGGAREGPGEHKLASASPALPQQSRPRAAAGMTPMPVQLPMQLLQPQMQAQTQTQPAAVAGWATFGSHEGTAAAAAFFSPAPAPAPARAPPPPPAAAPETPSGASSEGVSVDVARLASLGLGTEQAPPPAETSAAAADADAADASPTPTRQGSRASGQQARSLSSRTASSASRAGGAVDSAGTPVALEVRPAPLRQAQSERLAHVAAAGSSVLAAGDRGRPRVWRLGGRWEGAGAQWPAPQGAPQGEEDSEPYALFKPPDAEPPAVSCLHVLGSTLWSGHADGTVRAWRPGAAPGSPGVAGQCTLRWRAHRSAVVSMLLTAEGALWTGSSSGGVRAWKIGDGVPDEVQVSYQSRFGSFSPHAEPVPADGAFCREVCAPMSVAASASGNLHSRVRALALAGNVVWSGGNANLGLWDARTATLIRRVGYDFLDEHGNVLLGAEVDHADAAAAASSGASGANKSKGGVGGALRSMGKLARVAANKASASMARITSERGADEVGPRGRGRLNCMCAAPVDGGLWAGYDAGVVTQWSRQGTIVVEARLAAQGVPVRAIAAAGGARLWAGTADGYVHVLGAVGSMRGKVLARWRAHESPIMALSSDGPSMVSVAADGAVRVWHARSPTQVDPIAREAFEQELAAVSEERMFKLFVGTWNVNENRPSKDDIARWLCGSGNGSGDASAGTLRLDADLVAVGLQEVEMGGGSLVSAAAKNVVGNSKLSPSAQWWSDALTVAVQEATSGGALGDGLELVSFRQMAGIACGVWARRRLRDVSGDHATCTVACGALGNTLGNKGAAAVRVTLHRRSLAFISSHFAAHQRNIAERNADYARIASNLSFMTEGPAGSDLNGLGSRVMSRAFDRVQSSLSASSADDPSETESEGGGEAIRRSDSTASASFPTMTSFSDAADVIVWAGDFNYRIDGPNDEVRAAVARGDLDLLRPGDQLLREHAAGRTFRGMREAPIHFPPTYKFDKGLSRQYDTSEKQRTPAWTDRVLVYDRRALDDGAASVEVRRYEAEMDAFGSDHRPVRAELEVRLEVAAERARRECAARARAALGQALGADSPTGEPGSGQGAAMRAEADTVAVKFIGGETTTRVANVGKQGLLFRVEGADTLLNALPPWLVVEPSGGALAAGKVVGLRFSVSPHEAPPTGTKAQVAVRAVGEYGMRHATDPHEARCVINVEVC